MLRYCFALAQFLLVIWLLSCTCHAIHFDSGFTDKLIIDALQQSVRTRRDTLVKHKTQHLKPAIEIEPINEKVGVAMPHFNVEDLTAYANQAAAAIAGRFDEFEPTLLASNGKILVRFSMNPRKSMTRESRLGKASRCLNGAS